MPALLASALAVALTGYVVVRAEGDDVGRCRAFADASASRLAHEAPAVGAGRVVVIGDSYSVGLGLDDPLTSWPSRLPGRVRVAGFSGSGFSAAASPCGSVSFADRAPVAVSPGADIVVVEGGLNDWDRSPGEIRTGFRALMSTLEAPGRRVLVVGPASAPARVAQVPRVDAQLRRLARDAGVAYLSMADLDLTYLADRLHLTPAGHDTFGARVADAVRSLNRPLA